MTAKPETHGLKRYRITTTSTNPFGYDAKVKVKVYLASEAYAVIAGYEAREKRLVEEKEQYKTVYTNLCRDLRAERARYIAILQSWKNFDVWAASTVRVPDGQQAVTDAHDELSMKRDAILSEQEKP